MISVLILAGTDLMLLLSFVAEKKRRLGKNSICPAMAGLLCRPFHDFLRGHNL
jgi:hypothetical protein